MSDIIILSENGFQTSQEKHSSFQHIFAFNEENHYLAHYNLVVTLRLHASFLVILNHWMFLEFLLVIVTHACLCLNLCFRQPK